MKPCEQNFEIMGIIYFGFKDKAKYYGSPNHLSTFHILN